MAKSSTTGAAQRRSRPAEQAVGSGSAASSAHNQRLLKHGASTSLSSMGANLTIKAGNLAVLCGETGDMDAPAANAQGLFYHDMRYLDRALLRINGEPLTLLLCTDEENWRSSSELTNPELQLPDKSTLDKERLRVRRTRTLNDTVDEEITIRNFSDKAVDLKVDLTYAAAFADIFTIRGGDEGKRGKLHAPMLLGSDLVFQYDGADKRVRSTTVSFDPIPDSRADGTVSFMFHLASAQTVTLKNIISVRDEGPGHLETSPHKSDANRDAFTAVQVETSNSTFNRVLARCFDDLRMLLTHEHGDTYFAAGVPWYIALFGRDSIIAALQTLAYDADVARNTLQVLAKYQGTTKIPWRDEEPGKMLHEFRVGEKANLHEVPQFPYYGTVDATPLYIVLAGEYVRWSGDTALWHTLRRTIERALQWIDSYGDSDGDGFTDYHSTSGQGLVNQGWKDSGNSITNRDGSIAQPPIALVEVQGYVYRAWLEAACLYEGDGETKRAQELRRKAADLRTRFHEAFWMEDRSFLAVALQTGDRRVESLTSNAGQALWSGIVDEERAAAVAKTLLSDAMFSGWGIRTLAEGEAAYNPIDYQVGAVWPHDNSLIAAGLKRYGHDAEALRVFTAIFEAATNFAQFRLPEVFAGFSSSDYKRPVHYPVACRPQAWASGALPFFLHTMLGLEPDAPRKTLRIVRPALPDWLDDVTLRGLAVGDARIDLSYHRQHGGTAVAVLGRQGDLAVELSG